MNDSHPSPAPSDQQPYPPADGLYDCAIGGVRAAVAVLDGKAFELRDGRSTEILTSSVQMWRRVEFASELICGNRGSLALKLMAADGDYVGTVRDDGGRPVPTTIRIRSGRIHDASGASVHLSEVDTISPDVKDLHIARLRTALEDLIQAGNLLLLGPVHKGFLSAQDANEWLAAKAKAKEVLR